MNKTLSVKATGEVEQLPLGSYLYFYIRSASAPLQLSFDGNTWQDCGQNDNFGPLDPVPTRISFRAVNGIASNVTFSYSKTPIQSQDPAQSNAKSYILGNLGVATGAAAAGGLPQCDANGFLLVTNNMNLALSGIDSGHRRQLITFSLSANSPAPLNILDANGKAFMTILAGQQISLPTDSPMNLSGAGGTAWVTVGQIFLSTSN